MCIRDRIETIHGNIKQTMNEQHHKLKETVEGHREEMNAKFEENNKNLKQFEGKMAVSYTHLDVYKRQHTHIVPDIFKAQYRIMDYVFREEYLMRSWC